MIYTLLMSETGRNTHVEIHTTARMAEFDIFCQSILNEYDEYQNYYGRSDAPLRYNESLVRTYESTNTIQLLHEISSVIGKIPDYNEQSHWPPGWHFISGASLGVHLGTIVLGGNFDAEITTPILTDRSSLIPKDSADFTSYVDDLIDTNNRQYDQRYRQMSHSPSYPGQTEAVIVPVINDICRRIGYGKDSDRLYQSGFVMVCNQINTVLNTSTFQYEFSTIVDAYRTSNPPFSGKQ